uniref:IRG-type G domain-containing protein n=1 Tax=Panthera tigris altaica TaxID=74533 RepID=A0A8C9JHZ3_PANTA
MPPPRGDVTALFLGPPGSGKSALIAALCDRNVETIEIPEGRPYSGIPSLRASGPSLSCSLFFQRLFGENSTPRLRSLVLSPELSSLAFRSSSALYPLSSCPLRLLPPAQDGFEVLGAAELEAVREAFETGGLEAALSWVRAGLERPGWGARLDLAVAGTANVSLVLNTLLGLDPGDPDAEPVFMPAGPTPYPAPERPNVVLWNVPLGSAGIAAAPHPTHYDALILVTPGAPTEKDWAQVRPLVLPDAPLVCVRTDGEGEDPEYPEEEGKAEKPSSESLENAGGGELKNARAEGREKRGAGLQKAGSGEGPEKAGSESLPRVGGGAKKSGSGDSERAAALSPEDETWEVLEEAPPPVFPLRPGGLPGLCEWLRPTKFWSGSMYKDTAKGAPGWRSRLSVRLQPGHDLAVCEFEPRVGLWADGSEPGACFRFCVSLSLCPSPVHALSLSVPKINKKR